MKSIRTCAILSFVVCIVLSSCHVKHSNSATESSTPPNIADIMNSLDPADLTAGETAWINPRLTETKQADLDSITYTLSYTGTGYDLMNNENINICGVSSQKEHVVISNIIEGYPEIKWLLLGKDTMLRNARTIEIADGFQTISWKKDYGYMPVVESISIPASVTVIGHPWPIHLNSLQEICVDSANTHYVSHEGILYEYVGPSTQLILVCIPQNHSTTNSTLILKGGTVGLYCNAIYNVQTITKLVIPNSVTYIEEDAIIATAEHPLTIVCSRNSVAAEYVEKFGSLYHLTAEYTD